MKGLSVFQNKQGNFVMYGCILDWAHTNIHMWEYDLNTYLWAYKRNLLRNGPEVADVVGLQDQSGNYLQLSVDPYSGLYLEGAMPSRGFLKSATSPLAVFQNHAPNNANIEVFACRNQKLEHSWLPPSSTTWTIDTELTHGGVTGVAAFQNQAPNNLNYEVFVAKNGNLRHWWRDWNEGKWYGGAVVGKATGAVAAFQNMGASGYCNYEVFVVQGGSLRHLWRDWQRGQWYSGEVLGTADDGAAPDSAVAAFLNNVNQNYEVFAMKGGKPHHWWRDAKLQRWFSGGVDIDMAPKN